MNIYKFITLCSITTLARAIDPISNLALAIDHTTIFNSGNFSSPTITLTIDNNISAGYEIAARSANNSQFNLEGVGFDGSKDGHKLEYQFNCSSITLDDSSVISSNGLQTLTSDIAGTTMLSVANPSSATTDKDVTCTCQLLSGESASELLNGTYSDTITIDLNDL